MDRDWPAVRDDDQVVIGYQALFERFAVGRCELGIGGSKENLAHRSELNPGLANDPGTFLRPGYSESAAPIWVDIKPMDRSRNREPARSVTLNTTKPPILVLVYPKERGKTMGNLPTISTIDGNLAPAFTVKLPQSMEEAWENAQNKYY